MLMIVVWLADLFFLHVWTNRNKAVLSDPFL